MKFKAAILLSAVLLPTLAFAEDITLIDGTEYKDVTVTRVEQDGIIVSTPDGVVKLPFSQLSPEIKLVHPYKAPAVPATPAPVTSPSEGSVAELPPAKSVPKASQATSAPADTDSQKSSQPPFPYCGLLIKAGIALAAFLVSLLFVWFVACRLLSGLAKRREQKKELINSNVEQFHIVYADFFAIWKLWNYYQENNSHESPEHAENEIPHASRWELLERTYIAEGSLDSVFLKITAAGKLSASEVELLGRFRQAFQTLGQAITSNKPLNWKDAEHPDYLVFKRLASRVALMVNGENPGPQAADLSADAFRQITSARWERGWSSESTQS